MNKRGIVRLWIVQISVVVVITAFCATFFSYNAAISAGLGGLVCIIPNVYFAVKLFQYEGARSAQKIVKAFYKGEAVKIILSIILFTLVFVFCKVTPLAFFTTYIAVQMTHWFTPLIIVNKQHRQKSD